jgi:hypothetical protein
VTGLAVKADGERPRDTAIDRPVERVLGYQGRPRTPDDGVNWPAWKRWVFLCGLIVVLVVLAIAMLVLLAGMSVAFGRG